MKKISVFLSSLFVSILTFGQSIQPSLSYWFDTPTSLKGQAVWYEGKPENGKVRNQFQLAIVPKIRMLNGNRLLCL